MNLDYPLIWAGLIAASVLLYVLLDGFDLGVGILFPLARTSADRDAMMNTIAPYWDGNETWLVLGGGGLFAAFPLAYGVVAPALYLPLILMLLALILRGVAFEFRLRAKGWGKLAWTIAFSGGSLTAALAQGLVLGGFVQGIAVRGNVFIGGPFDWLSPYAILTAVGLVAGYALLGATWLILRTEDDLHGHARRWAAFAAGLTAGLLATVSLATLFVQERIAERWGLGTMPDLARLLPLLPIPILGLAGFVVIGVGLKRRSHGLPFAGAAMVFISGYLGLAASFFPYVAPYALTFRQAANADNALELMAAGTAILLPVILGYTAWVYWVFRGKVAADAGYH